MIVLTHGYFLEDDLKEQKIMKPYVPLGILYISAFLESKRINHEVFDSTFSNFEKFKIYLEEKKPKLIGIYTNLMTKIMVLKMVEYIKKSAELKSCKIILGGPEIRYNAENYLNTGADMLVVGEGEETFFELCDQFLKTGHLSNEVSGTAFLVKKEVVFTQERSLIKDINVLPMPARKNIDLNLYGNAWKKHHGYSMYSVSTMRGCPYTCKWCSRAVYGGTYRRRSPKLVVDELEYLKINYNPDQIWFVDDVFTINHKWLKEFKTELLSRKIVIPYEIITRADRMNDEVIQILKETGCFRVWIGAESGSQKIIDAMDRRVEVTMVREMIIKTKKAGIQAGTFIMLGYPGENRSDIKETINHLQLSDPTFYTITVAYPITGTPLYNEVSSTLNSLGDWQKRTDREYDFQRKHSKKFYLHAIDWVYNEVNFKKTNNIIKKVKHKSRSVIAQAMMFLS
ncbi:B12-binding domain-containing radical SAM protein [Aurantibacillus circumpalustris]|uniref:B12-binding domain-containing radical SAM protein n=1 Tax=Aurantibacillus circumpalustris TaxID=3036359 RepID=UPI00295A8535|nr:radical SAM protein [Aurantibacillus circumpalustris]